MGGLFSRKSEVTEGSREIPKNQYQRYSSYNAPFNYSYEPRPPRPQQQITAFYREGLGYEQIHIQQIRQLPISSTCPQLRESSVLQRFNSNFFPDSITAREIFMDDFITYYKLSPFDEEYRDIKRRITNKYFKIDSIDKIDAPFLKKSYILKKNQMAPLEELELFHGTNSENVDSICENNFNWRYKGQHVGHRFGQGVSFSCNAMYAANYSDEDRKDKVMFIAKVMIGKRCKGTKTMILPEDGCDTSTKQGDNIVLVKYEDNEFYPLYLIRFHIAPGYVPMNQRA